MLRVCRIKNVGWRVNLEQRFAKTQFANPALTVEPINFAFTGFAALHAARPRPIYVTATKLVGLISTSRKAFADKKSSRSEFSLPENCNLYGCFQALFKIHPSFDSILHRITELDRHAKLVFFRLPSKLMEVQLKFDNDNAVSSYRFKFDKTESAAPTGTGTSCGHQWPKEEEHIF